MFSTQINGSNYKNYTFKCWEFLKDISRNKKVYIHCQNLPATEDPSAIHIYINAVHQNGNATRLYFNGNTSNLLEISKGIDANFYCIPKIHLNSAFLKIIKPNSAFYYIDYFHLLAENYPLLRANYNRQKKLLPTSAVSAILLVNLLPIDACQVNDLDLYYPNYNGYKINHEGVKPPHSERFDLFCLNLINLDNISISSVNPKVNSL